MRIETPPATRYVLTYRAVSDFLPLVAEHGAGHSARLAEFRERGLVALAGPLLEPFDGTAMAVFTTREAVDEFVRGDPFVLGGLVAGRTVRPWSERLGQ
ncbi:MAG: YciI family protein [Actinomycetota bacterium]|nr:YciI family protein [Actinomycetota bacterium]